MPTWDKICNRFITIAIILGILLVLSAAIRLHYAIHRLEERMDEPIEYPEIDG